MKRTAVKRKRRRLPARESLTEAYEVRAFREEPEEGGPALGEGFIPEIAHPDAEEFQRIKTAILGHGEQTVIPDDCQFGDNELCYVDA